MSKYLDENGLLYFWGKIKSYVSGTVSGFYTKPNGGIPKSDLSDAVQSSLEKADTAIQDISRKANIASPSFTGTPTAPTAADGTNTTQIATTAFVTTAVNNAIGSVIGISYEIVTSLPQSGSAGVIYLVSNSGSGTNVYDEYIWVDNRFEKIGSTDVDLSGYLQTTAFITNAEIDTIVAS